MIACQQAEFNRDRKKRKKPYDLEDFYCYKINSDKDTVDAPYGSAASELISRSMFPSWGLFIYKELMVNASKATAPEVLCYSNKHAIILAPKIVGDTCIGMLIATEYASYRVLEFQEIKKQEGGEKITYRIRMPEVKGKTAAVENCCLDILG